MFLEGGWGVSTVDRIMSDDGIDDCTLGSLSGVVAGFHGELSVLAWYGAGVGTGCTLSYYSVSFVGSTGRGKNIGVYVGSGSELACFRVWGILM